MSLEPWRKHSSAVARILFGRGDHVAGVVYGTIVVMATLAATYATEKDPVRLALVVTSTVVVLWVAHVYAHGLSEGIARRRRLRREDVSSLARRELGILLAAALPVAALLLGALHVLGETSAVWLALAIGLVTLGAEGVRYSRLEHLRPGPALVVVSANLALGLVVVLMKVALAH